MSVAPSGSVAFTHSLPNKDDAVATRAIIVAAIDPIAQPPLLSDACFQALLPALREVPWYLKQKRDKSKDVLVDALAHMLEWIRPQPKGARVALFKAVLARLSDEDRVLAMRTFVQGYRG